MTAARVPLPHWCTQSRPYRHPRPAPAVHGPAYFTAFARSAKKQLIAVGQFERNVKDHPSMFLKLRFRVLRRSRNDTFLRAFVNTLSSFWPSSGGSMSETVLLMRRCWWLTGQVGPPLPPLSGRPHRLTAGRGAAVPAPARTVSGSVSYCKGSVNISEDGIFRNIYIYI